VKESRVKRQEGSWKERKGWFVALSIWTNCCFGASVDRKRGSFVRGKVC